jgi:hypothetical protein
MARVLTLPPVPSMKGRVCHCSSVKHCMEALDPCIYLFAILRHQGHELIDYDPRGQSIVCRRVVNLFALPQDLVNFFVKRPRPI